MGTLTSPGNKLVIVFLSKQLCVRGPGGGETVKGDPARESRSMLGLR